jgi:hypothetical protein
MTINYLLIDRKQIILNFDAKIVDKYQAIVYQDKLENNNYKLASLIDELETIYHLVID